MHATALNALIEWGRVHEVRRAQPKLSGPLILESCIAGRCYSPPPAGRLLLIVRLDYHLDSIQFAPVVSPVHALPVKTLILDLVGGDLGAPLGFARVADPMFQIG